MLLSPASATAALVTIWLLRVAWLQLRRRTALQPAGCPPVQTMIVMGSGGHTAEMLTLLQGLDAASYAPREYVIATTDSTSAQRVEAFEKSWAGGQAFAQPKYELLRLPRSREVGQSYVSSLFTTLYASLCAAVMVFRKRPSLLLTNGPGTCVPVCAASVGLRLLGLKSVTIVYVESICRVHTLSLSGRLLLHVADHFLVQWPQLATKYPRTRYIGRLC